MPLYEYACPSCDQNFELLVRFGENPPCPECGSTRLEKQLSVPAAHVAGGKSLPICEAHLPAAVVDCRNVVAGIVRLETNDRRRGRRPNKTLVVRDGTILN